MSKPVMNKGELQQAILNERGIRVTRSHTESQLQEVLQYKRDVSSSPVDAMREQLIAFISENKSRLSLSCDGDCHKHTDGVVLYCHATLLEDNNGETTQAN
tara:strand:- start:221 stop:523 length:303 start_codon:yes stop_codon:yes gene_type:complete